MSRRTRWWAILLVLLLGAALATRLWQLHREAPWLDEVFTIMHLHAPSMDTYLAFLRSVCPPALPVYYGIVYLWAQVAGTEILVLRIPHVLAGAASIGASMIFTKRIAGRRAALIAGGLLAFSLPHIYYSQELRAYTWVMLWTPVSMWALVRAVERGGVGAWATHLAANALLLLSHALNVVLLPAQAAYLVLFDRSPKRRAGLIWLAANSLSFAAVLYSQYVSWESTAEAAHRQGPRGFLDVLHAYAIFAGGRPLNFAPDSYMGGWPNAEPAILLLWAVILAWAACGTAVRIAAVLGASPGSASRWPHFLQRRILLWGWLVVPPLSMYAIALFTNVQFMFRYVMPTMFPMAALAAVTLSQRRRRAWRTGAAVLLSGLLAYQAIVYVRPFRPDYQAAVDHIRQSGDAGMPVVVLKDLNGQVFSHMKWFPRQQVVVREGMEDAVSQAAEAARVHGAAWLVTWRWDALARLEAKARQEGLAEQRSSFGGTPPVVLYRFEPAEASTGQTMTP